MYNKITKQFQAMRGLYFYFYTNFCIEPSKKSKDEDDEVKKAKRKVYYKLTQ